MATNDPNAIPWGATGVSYSNPTNYISTGSVTANSYNADVIRGSEIYVEHKEFHDTIARDASQQNTHNNIIKEKLMKDMLQYMLNNNYIEFTNQYDPLNNEFIYRARAYLVPDDQVRLLRTTGSIK